MGSERKRLVMFEAQSGNIGRERVIKIWWKGQCVGGGVGKSQVR